MQYNFQDFTTEYSPVMGIYPHNNQNLFQDQMFNGFPYNIHPNQFGEYQLPTDIFMYDNQNNFSRQTTMLKSRISTPINSQNFFPGFIPLPSSQNPGFFRRRNSTNLLRNKTRSRSFRRSLSNSTNNTKIFIPKNNINNNYQKQHTSITIQKSNDGKQIYTTPYSNRSSNLSRINSYEYQGSEQSNYDSNKNIIKLRPRKSKKDNNLEKTSPFNRAFKSLKDDFELPKLDTKDAMEFFEGFLLAAFNILRTIIGELRADIIMGLFKPNDPDYDAARSYYYNNLNENVPSSGLTQRIDYTEAIENEYMKIKDVEKIKITNDGVNEYINMGNKDFMNMSEKEFEEFLLKESYLEVPLSVPRL